MRVVEVGGELDRLFQPLDGALCVVVLNFSHSPFIFLEGLFRNIGRQLPDIHNLVPAHSVPAAGGHRASVQKDEYVWCPWNVDRIIHVFEAFQAKANVVGALRDVVEFEIPV